MREDRVRKGFRLVGDDRNLGSGLMQRRDRVRGAQHQRGQVRQMKGVDVHHPGVVRIERFAVERFAAGRVDTLDQRANAVADHSAHLWDRQRTEPVPSEQFIHRRRDVGRRVDQRAIEVEQHRRGPAAILRCAH